MSFLTAFFSGEIAKQYEDPKKLSAEFKTRIEGYQKEQKQQ